MEPSKNTPYQSRETIQVAMDVVQHKVKVEVVRRCLSLGTHFPFERHHHTFQGPTLAYSWNKGKHSDNLREFTLDVINEERRYPKLNFG